MAATVSIIESKTILEGNSGTQTLSFDIVLSTAITSPVQVPYQIGKASDTATIDEDYTVSFDPIIFNPGDPLIKTLNFQIIGDRITEADEVFTITLGTPIGATLGTNTVATGTILNDDSLPTINIAPTTNASEAGTIGSFTLTRTTPTELPLTVTINTSGGSATANTDHQTLPTQVTFAAGQTQATINVTPIDDDFYEGNETIQASLVASSTYTLGTTPSAAITIIDNEAIPTLTITPLTQNIVENNSTDSANNASFQVQLSGKSATPITVNYNTVNGTATAGSDFTSTSGQLTFAPGILSQTISVPIIPDNTIEPDETFALQLTNPLGAVISNNSSTVNILNDDNPIVVNIPVITITAGVNVQEPNTAGTFILQRTGDLTSALTVNLMTTSATETINYQAIATTVIFAAGSNTATIEVKPIDDDIYEGTAKVGVLIQAGNNYSIGSSATAEISIEDNETIPTITISDSEIIEGDSGTSLLRFRVRLSNPSAQAITVNYQTQDGIFQRVPDGALANPTADMLALAGRDYTASNGTLTFAAQEVEKIIEVPIIGDKTIERDERFTITLSNPSNGAILNQANANGLIKNNDKATVSVTVPDAQAGEPNNPGQFSINIDNPTEIPIAIQYTLTGSATVGTDYQTLPRVVTIAPGQTSQPININVLDDNILEGTEVVQLKLQPSPDYQIADGQDTGIVSITDDEKALPTLTTTSTSIFKIENGVSTGTTLKFSKLVHQASLRNELSLFTVDDDNGTIGGIAPGQAGYQNAAIKRSQVIFSSLSDSPVDLQLDGQIDRYINLGTNERIGFLLVAGSSIDEINQGTTADVLFSFPSANIGSNYTRITTTGTTHQLSWEDSKTAGDGDFNDLGLEISIQPAPNIIGTEQQGTKDLVDLRSFTGQKTFDISITGDAFYRNTVGLYRVDDLDGKIDGLKFGDSGYLAAALQRIVTSGVKGDNLVVQLDGGSILAPFLVANNSVANVLAGATAPVYFGNAIGNADKVDHIRLLGDNKFAFEDLVSGGDKDFNDVILQISARPQR